MKRQTLISSKRVKNSTIFRSSFIYKLSILIYRDFTVLNIEEATKGFFTAFRSFVLIVLFVMADLTDRLK